VLRGGVDIDVIDTHTSATDHAEFRRGLDDLFRHLGLGTHDHRHDIGDERQKLGFGELLRKHGDLEFRPLLQKSYAFG
jgi:hypothetical protein